jgi:hypothetical protein
MLIKRLVLGCLIPIGCLASDNTGQGFIEGHLKIISPRVVQPSDEMPRSEMAPESYAAYPLIVLSQQEKKEITRFAADENGNYRVALPPGNYLLDVEDRMRKRVRGQPQHFTILSNQTVHVDMNVIIGFR